MPQPNDQELIPSMILKKALDSALKSLGIASKQAIFEDLERSGIHLDDKNASYTIVWVDRYLTSLLGVDAARLLIERLKKELRTKE